LAHITTVGQLLKRRLKETNRTPEELAEAAQVPTEYILKLMDGTQRPPLPGRTDVYEKMTRFLGLGRTDLATGASAERAAAAPETPAAPGAAVRRLLFAFCEPATAEELERRAKRGKVEVGDFLQRLLDVTHGAVHRLLHDPVALRITASQRGSTFAEVRQRVLVFLDATPDCLTADDIDEFIRPYVTLWDVDLETGVLRVVLRGHEPRGRGRAPLTRRTPRMAS
jgi:hypothetical protein